MKKLMAVFAVSMLLLFAYGCASTDALKARMTELEDRVGKLEQTQKADTTSLEADVKKANDDAVRAESAAKKAEDAAVKAEAAEKAAVDAEQKAETAAKKSTKGFELMQKK